MLKGASRKESIRWTLRKRPRRLQHSLEPLLHPDGILTNISKESLHHQKIMGCLGIALESHLYACIRGCHCLCHQLTLISQNLPITDRDVNLPDNAAELI
ncbi:uncharacterized protein TrAFT101_011983 [Trichoderma asperellum]|uniref:uncharacterized protein n=1 Tax=Trichoderma asperellum TaxID=101201 RepID=UPI0033298DBD|nr:hypothetical protein TrAFT101_011983 [Trichoderma asperellum]